MEPQPTSYSTTTHTVSITDSYNNTNNENLTYIQGSFGFFIQQTYGEIKKKKKKKV